MVLFPHIILLHIHDLPVIVLHRWYRFLFLKFYWWNLILWLFFWLLFLQVYENWRSDYLLNIVEMLKCWNVEFFLGSVHTFIRLYNFWPVVVHGWWVISSFGSIKSLSPHLAYQMTGSHRCIAFNAESPKVSKHSDGMRQ